MTPESYVVSAVAGPNEASVRLRRGSGATGPFRSVRQMSVTPQGDNGLTYVSCFSFVYQSRRLVVPLAGSSPAHAPRDRRLSRRQAFHVLHRRHAYLRGISDGAAVDGSSDGARTRHWRVEYIVRSSAAAEAGASTDVG